MPKSSVVDLLAKSLRRRELETQKAVWKTFGVNYEAEKAKQQEIWRTLKEKQKGKGKGPLPPRTLNQHSLRALVPQTKKAEYEALKAAIYNRLRRRRDFSREIDTALIEQAARLFADWLYVEEIMSAEKTKEDLIRYADALVKIHSMLITTLRELHITPSLRRKIVTDLQEEDEIKRKLKKLTGAA